MLGDLVAFQRRLTQDGQLRWIGPEKGALAMACGAVLNAAWDLAARRAGLPLWEFVASLEPEALVEMIDLKHLSDVVTKDAALAFLKKKRPGWQKRVAEMKRDGYPAYTTSAGWLGYPEAKVRALCREYVAAGHRYFKMKVGSPDPADDVMRARAIREEIGDDRVLMMDANQKWDVPEAIANMRQLAAFRPLWIEEPTHCDDVVGHREIARALRPLGVGVATGEVAQNKVIFKQLLQEDAIEFCQIDSCRIAGPSEIFAVLLMAAMKNVKVCPHAGGVGLCEYVRHLSMIDYVRRRGARGGSTPKRRPGAAARRPRRPAAARPWNRRGPRRPSRRPRRPCGTRPAAARRPAGRARGRTPMSPTCPPPPAARAATRSRARRGTTSRE